MPWSPVTAYGHHACAPSSFAHDTASRASYGSVPHPPGAAAGAAAYNQTAAAATPGLSSATAARHHRAAWWHCGRSLAPAPSSGSLAVKKSSQNLLQRCRVQAVSASSFFSRQFWFLSAFISLASDTSIPPWRNDYL